MSGPNSIDSTPRGQNVFAAEQTQTTAPVNKAAVESITIKEPGEGPPSLPKDEVRNPKKSALQTFAGIMSQIGRAAVGWTGGLVLFSLMLPVAFIHGMGKIFCPDDRQAGRIGGEKNFGVDDIYYLYFQLISSAFTWFRNVDKSDKTSAKITESPSSKIGDAPPSSPIASTRRTEESKKEEIKKPESYESKTGNNNWESPKDKIKSLKEGIALEMQHERLAQQLADQVKGNAEAPKNQSESSDGSDLKPNLPPKS